MCAGDRIGDQEGMQAPLRSVKMGSGGGYRSLRYLKQKHNIQTQEKVKDSPVVYKSDWMALTTTYSKQVLQMIKGVHESLMKSRFSKYMPRARTLSHLIMVTALAIIMHVFIEKHKLGFQLQTSKLWAFSYLLSFSVHFGTQVWMTLVSGLVLYFNLPRHIFGQVQQNLFPAYYVHCAILSFVMVISFIKAQPEVQIFSRDFCQVLTMTLTFFVELAIRLYVSNAVVMLKHMKTKMEAASGSGQEVGQHVLGNLAHCPHYMKVLKKFRKLHSYTAIGTVLTVVCSIYHVSYLADKICL